MSNHRAARSRETSRVVARRPWGRAIVVAGVEFRWMHKNASVVVRSPGGGYHRVGELELAGLDEAPEDGVPIRPSDVADWIRHNLLAGAGPHGQKNT